MQKTHYFMTSFTDCLCIALEKQELLLYVTQICYLIKGQHRPHISEKQPNYRFNTWLCCSWPAGQDSSNSSRDKSERLWADSQNRRKKEQHCCAFFSSLWASNHSDWCVWQLHIRESSDRKASAVTGLNWTVFALGRFLKWTPCSFVSVKQNRSQQTCTG